MAHLWSESIASIGSGANLSSLAYSYDPNDNIGAIRDQLDDSRSLYYGYDANDRLSFASMTVGTPAADTESYSYTAGTNRMASVTSSAGTRAIGYDGRGNTSSETRPGGASVGVTYDGYGRLLTYNRTGDPAQTNVYNGLDDRVSVTSASTTRTYVYDPEGRVIGEYGSSAAEVIAETIWLQPEVANDNQPLGGDDGVGGYAPLAVATGSGGSSTLYWVHGNHLGVPLVTTDASGAAVTPAGYTMPGYPGQQRTLADLYYNRYRDYDSSTGRYIQADPIGLAGGNNPYLYAEGNPLKNVDPDGLNPAAVRGAIAVGEGVGQGFVWWCRSHIALCARTIGPPIVRAGKAINSAISGISDWCDDDDDCERLLNQIEEVTNEINERFAAQLKNKYWLYEFARYKDKPHPRLPGTWEGHNEQISGKQTQLRNLILEANSKHCIVPPSAFVAAYRPLPIRPARYEK